MGRIYLIRHGETTANIDNQIQGRSNLSLTPNGSAEIKHLALSLKEKGIQFNSIYSSNQKRAIETTEIILSILEQQHLSIKTDEKLREWEFGSFDGQNMREAFKGFSIWNKLRYVFKKLTLEQVANYIFTNDTSGEAENWKDLKNRTKLGFSPILTEAIHNRTHNILVVSHGLTILTFLYLIDKKEASFRTLPNGSVTIVENNGTNFTIDKLLF